jgi:AsmA-like C-terminal region
MASATVPPEVQYDRPSKVRPGRLALVALIVFAALVCGSALLFTQFWPFDQKPITRDLEHASDSRVTMRGFHRTFFPHPGCVIDRVVFTRPGNVKFITADRVTIQGSYSGMLARHVDRVIAEGMHVFVPARGTGQEFHTQHGKTTVGEIVADGAKVEIARTSGKPLLFDIHKGALRNVAWGRPITYDVQLHNPEPAAEIAAAGQFGPWQKGDPAQTAVSGEYRLERLNLGAYGGIAGTLASTGKFEGKLGHIDVAGKADTPDFEVRSAAHPVRVASEFVAYVDGTNGDTFLKRVDARFKKTHVVGEGQIAAKSGKGKTVEMNLSVPDGRIEDLLGLFVKEPRSPMSGKVTLRAKAELPPGKEKFLQKLAMQGGFGIDAGEFTNPKTQQSVNKLSAGGSGNEHTDADDYVPTALTDLNGKVDMEHGVATFTDLTFGVPGAKTHLRGTYSLLRPHKIDLRGQMKLDSKMSNTTSGMKSFLLKVIDPFLRKRKRHEGEIVPVRISGTYGNAHVGLALGDDKAKSVKPPKHPKPPQ